MAESSEDPLLMPHAIPTSVRKAYPEQRRSNPLYVPKDDAYELGKQESSDPTLLKSSPRVTPKRALWLGVTPRTPRVEVQGKLRLAVEEAPPVEENGDLTLRPDLGYPDEEPEAGDRTVLPEHMEEDESFMRDFWNPDAAEAEFDRVQGEKNMATELEHQRDEMEDDDDQEMYDLAVSEGEFQPHTSDDELAFRMKPPEEQEEIGAEIEDLLVKIPDLHKDYQLIDRLGTGQHSVCEAGYSLNGMGRYILVGFQSHRP